MTRVAVVDIGSNSTRLLVADVDGGSVRELQRESTVTRLGDGVDATGRLGDEPQGRVFAVLDTYAEAIDRYGAEVRTAVLTSAVRDAANGAEFTAAVRERYGLDARTLSGDDEARLTFLGATVARDPGDPTPLRRDRHRRRVDRARRGRARRRRLPCLHPGRRRPPQRAPPALGPAVGRASCAALAADARGAIEAAVPAAMRERAAAAVAVAGTATSCAAIDLALDPYDPARVEGHVLSRSRLVELRDRLAAMPLAQRRSVTGLMPARAPTIVAGGEILLEVLSAFGLDAVEVSDRDILWGAALASATSA